MTIETCKRLAEHCRKNNDEAGALMYEARIERKKRKLGIVDPIEPVEKEIDPIEPVEKETKKTSKK